MFTLTGNRLLDVIIVLVSVYIISEVVTFLFLKFVKKDVTKPVGVSNEHVNNQTIIIERFK